MGDNGDAGMRVTADWADGNPDAVRKRLQAAGVSDRKCRLFCAACCRAAQGYVKHRPCLDLLDLVEAWADDPCRAPEVERGRRAVGRWAKGIQDAVRSERDFLTRWSAYCAADPVVVPVNRWFLTPPRFRRLLREVVGPDLPPRTLPPECRSGDAVGVAQAVYEGREFDRLPVLADALVDAGCDDEAILAHCRSKGPHVRGCWVVDLVLGKE
jgi:hypothetical protein